MSSSRFFVIRTVAQAIVIPPLLYVVLDNFRSAEVNRDNYCGSPQGEVTYVRNFLRPFAHVIRSSIPSMVCGPDDMPFGRAAELEKYVLVYIERAALLYAISFEVSRRSEQPMTLDPSKPERSILCGGAAGDQWSRGRKVIIFKGEMFIYLGGGQRETGVIRSFNRFHGHIKMGFYAQGLHHTTNIATEEETPHETVGLIRDAVSMLLKNMVVLGKASLKYGAIEGPDAPGYFVPSEGTTLFGMAERFVDLYGYHGDGSPFDRALMFDNLNTLFRSMVLDKEYLWCRVDFPNFELSKEDLERYGIYEFIKPRQIARIHAKDPRIVRHQFGDRLLQYNPKLGEAAQYTFPDPSQEYAATRPNTPVLSLMAEVADEMEEDGEESDKENESP
ncbi:hypothetical protein B0H14DRAFT_2645935 [Mycena olivaceomarginata]|nr:hypothetical protein B0H14DRAFT_2645935 [Mycena olivaceomarginata]